MAPVVRCLRASTWATPILVTTGQQQDLLNQALDDFGLVPDFSIPHQRTVGNVASTLGALITSLNDLFEDIRPDCIIAQGDTTSVFAASLVAFYRQIPFVHIEAGLRTGDLSSPFPEEFHRRAVAITAGMHCAPTQAAASHLRSEGIPESRILISGNTVIDALLATAEAEPTLPSDFPIAHHVILLTAHRRENFGAPLSEAFKAIRAFVDARADMAVFFPVHPNPAARSAAHKTLADHPRIVLAEPCSYPEIVAAMQRAWLIVTDSGGLQEEAPALGTPVFVLRDSTERPEAVSAGAAKVIGTSGNRVLRALNGLYRNDTQYLKMATPVFPYGDGHAAERIVNLLQPWIARHAAGEVLGREKSSVLSRVG